MFFTKLQVQAEKMSEKSFEAACKQHQQEHLWQHAQQLNEKEREELYAQAESIDFAKSQKLHQLLKEGKLAQEFGAKSLQPIETNVLRIGDPLIDQSRLAGLTAIAEGKRRTVLMQLPCWCWREAMLRGWDCRFRRACSMRASQTCIRSSS